MKISFLGGADEIGASCTLLEVAGKSFLIDCGVRFKTGQALPDLNELTGKSLGAILITHAHTDHTGALSIIHEAFPNTPIYTTPPSADLISILQKDALHIMEQALDKEGEYDDQKTEGSSHNPVFYVRAWAEAPGGVRENGVVANAPNKKKSMLLAASNLLDKLQELRWY